MPEPQNNFLIFNENNNQGTTLSQEDYLALAYRISGLIPMIADPIAHNKMYRQWSLMCNAIGAMINDKNLDALDTNSSDLKNNLKTAVKGLARDELSTEIITLGNIDTWKESITATPAELNTLDGITASTAELNILDSVTASTTELNYSTGLIGNIQQQINAITGVISNPFPTWNASTSYGVGDICIASNFKSYQYLECVVAGTTGTTPPANADVGQMVTDNEVKWLVCDFRDSAPVGTFRSDMIQRLGWLKANGATVNRADYPRLWAYAVDNLLTTNDTTNNPGLFGEGDGVDTFELPNFEDYFIRYSYVRGVGTKQDSQMASHTHTCQDHTGSHDHTSGNQSANHSHSCGNQDTSHTHTINNDTTNHTHDYGYPNEQITIIQGNLAQVTGIWRDMKAIGTSNQSVHHNHTAGNQSASHKHSIGNQSANHNHIINSKSITHKHTIDPAGSGTNTYPDNIAMQMFIKY